MNLPNIIYLLGTSFIIIFGLLLSYVGVKKYAFSASKNKSKELSSLELKIAISAFLFLIFGVALLFVGVVAEVN